MVSLSPVHRAGSSRDGNGQQSSERFVAYTGEYHHTDFGTVTAIIESVENLAICLWAEKNLRGNFKIAVFDNGGGDIFRHVATTASLPERETSEKLAAVEIHGKHAHSFNVAPWQTGDTALRGGYEITPMAAISGLVRYSMPIRCRSRCQSVIRSSAG